MLLWGVSSHPLLGWQGMHRARLVRSACLCVGRFQVCWAVCLRKAYPMFCSTLFLVKFAEEGVQYKGDGHMKMAHAQAVMAGRLTRVSPLKPAFNEDYSSCDTFTRAQHATYAILCG